MRTYVFVVALALIAFTVSGSLGAQSVVDGCSVVRAADLQPLAAAAKVAPGTPGTDGVGSRKCKYEWGPGNSIQSGHSFLTVSVTPVSKMFPGMDISIIRQALTAAAQAGKPNNAVIPGLGDVAVYESSDPTQAKATAVFKGQMIIVSLETQNARTQKDQVAALLKIAAGRL